eukprot:TRINITY_DN3666_c2_g1_i1.p1 TRINITY_DN3666_c2_g1~~TRINITY_DN3666_c2_g1_i1.p1  ORF type:complete len:292 (-),score=84.92 TRINITY_DN3666_c2_g1_i1:411-1244(-)
MSNTFIPRTKAVAQQPSNAAAAAAAADAKQGGATKDHEERLQLLGRLSEKLLSNREFEERERYITELARQEAEIEHLRNLVSEQARKIQEQDAFFKAQEAQMDQLRQQAARGVTGTGGGGGGYDSRAQAEHALQLQQLRAELAEKDRHLERLTHTASQPAQQDPRLAAELSAARANEAQLTREVSGLHNEVARLRSELDQQQQQAKQQQQSHQQYQSQYQGQGQGQGQQIHNKSYAAPPKAKRDDEVILEEIPEEPENRIEPTPAPAPPSRPIPDEF